MKGKVSLLFVVVLLGGASLAGAANGHSLHGIGAVNSAMGGAGVALPNDPLGALLLNPALLTHLDGGRFAFSAEYNTAKNAVESRVGPFSGRTEEAGDPAVIPAFGWTRHKSGTKAAYGVGFLGMAGFGVDYPQDSTNPILSPQPNGFGRTYSNYALLKIPQAVAWQFNNSLSIGGSLNVARATLTADPAGFAAPDCSGPAGPCFVPRVNPDSAWGFGLGLGVYYQLNPAFALGFSYNSEMDFEDFEFNSTVANPNLPTFGRARKIKFQLNFPETIVAGIGFTPNKKLSIALDAKLVGYEDTEGFADLLGFEDMTVFGLGLQYQLNPMITLRGGYNWTDQPIPDDRTFFTVEVPAIFEERVTAGAGLRLNQNFSLDVAYYHVFENRITGPIFGPTGPIPGTSVTTEMAMDSLVFTFSFNH